ncbi:TonB-dependent receptor [Mucilaginibacter glaciei]|uniref:TonB-dependent receptor n=1 Tax=Mucilaginibacter glaciei TaxID=2772109 RepID=A0A926NW08_9SPHI|nr:TonB-dependent receptor [Mucilaginibacter glaciei]MBD1392749.1 TonB-dependent receptor [Mucilaginibacter glaciei]
MSRLNKPIGAFIFCMLCYGFAFSQSIRGTVTDSLGKGISYAGVNLKGGGSLIIGYTTTNDKGAFTLSIPTDADKNNLQVEVSCVGFKKAIKPVGSFTMPYNFKMSHAVSQLQTVVVKDNKPRLRAHGDTLDYKVSDFSNPQDRVIGDVIKKLPGITVDKDGKISYNGKGISNLYIGGDNLLDDKYNIATSSIPNGVVDKVQVMENHQPIKMLKDKVVSEDVALNLTMKKDAKLQLVGQETLGAGLPDKYYADINAMAFKDKYKAINYLKVNNTNYDLAGDIISHNYSSYLARLDYDKPGTVLSLGTAGDPDLPRNRYLFNQAGIINLNNLVNVKKDVQLRANLSYLHDTQKQIYTKFSEFYLPNDTIRYAEAQNNRRRPDYLHTQLGLNINKDKYYLTDNFIADYTKNTGYSALVANGTPVNQVFKDNIMDLSNEFNYMNTFKSNNIIELYSYVNRSIEPEVRTIDPGLNPDIFNNNVAYKQLTQTVDVPTWFTNNYLGYKIPGSNITQSYKAGFSLQSQTLRSNLSLTQLNNSTNLVSDSAVNNLDWSKRKVYAEAGYDIPGNIWKLSISLPLSYMNISYSDGNYNLNKSLDRLYFNPRVSIKYQSGIENFFALGYNFRNDIGSIQDVYNGFILKNYRSLYANNADLTERKTQTANLGFNFRKAITLFFFGVNAAYTHQNANNIASSIITNNIQQRIVLPYDNNIDTWSGTATISKYAFAIRTTFSGGLSIQTTKLNQIQNNIVLPYNTVSKAANIGAETKVSSKVNFSYRAGYDQTVSKSSAVATSSKFERLIQQGSVSYIATDNLYFSLSGDHYYTHQQQSNDLKYMFADASVRYKLKKVKADVELSAQNLFNTTTYSALYLSANTFTQSSYTIPGRFMLAKLTFTL